MADPAQARQIMDGLPAKDPIKALEEIADWLESVNHADGFEVDRRLESVELFDIAARRHQTELTKEYLSTPRVQKFLENRLWSAGFAFCQQLGDAYIRCIKEYLSGFSGSTATGTTLPVIVARGMHAFALQLKWTLLRYGLVEERIWAEIAQLYRLAGQKEIADESVVLYPGADGETTVRREFLKALMLTASSTDGLPPVRQDIAERVIAHFAGAFRLSARPDGCTHSFDLAAPRSPARLLKAVYPAPTLLFFGAGEGLARLRQLKDLASARAALPQEINLGGVYPHDVVLDVLKYLEQYWSDKPLARGSERRLTAARVTVVPGVDEVFAVLDPSRSSQLDFSGHLTAESWIVENVSDGGYGAIIPAQKTDWIKVGTLIGIKTETSNYLGVGLIRRIARDAHQQRRVGIQLLTKAAIPVVMSKSGAITSVNVDLTTEPAILLTATPDAQGEVGVLLRGGAFSGREKLEMRYRDQSYLLMPQRIVEFGEDFDWAKFKVVERLV